jgi:hypothetical protein
MDVHTARETTSYVTTPKFSSILEKPKVHYRIHKSHPFIPILSQTNPVYRLADSP